MSIKEDRLRTILGYVAAECGMKKWHYKKDENGTVETYFGILIPVTVTGVSDGKEINRRVFVKWPSVIESIRAFSHYLWDTEAYVYNTLVPIWKRVSKLNVDELIPPCYYTNTTLHKQILVLKDMRSEGYRTCTREILDFEHVIVALKTLAHFHALSIIGKERHGEMESSLLRPYTDTYPPQLNKAMLACFRLHSQLFKGTKYEHYWETTLENINTIAIHSTSKAKCLVYGHGDYGKENVLYKYKLDGPVSACILDFQTCRLMTPAFDFLYFIMICTDGKIRRLHYENFVTEYYISLKSILIDHDIHLETFYKNEDFISDLKIVASICFIRFCLAFSLWLGFESEAEIKSKSLWKDNQTREKNMRHFKNMLIDAMEDLNSYGYICL